MTTTTPTATPPPPSTTFLVSYVTMLVLGLFVASSAFFSYYVDRTIDVRVEQRLEESFQTIMAAKEIIIDRYDHFQHLNDNGNHHDTAIMDGFDSTITTKIITHKHDDSGDDDDRHEDAATAATKATPGRKAVPSTFGKCHGLSCSDNINDDQKYPNTIQEFLFDFGDRIPDIVHDVSNVMNDIVHDLLVYFDVGDSNNHDGDATTADSSKNVRSNELHHHHRRRQTVAAAAATRSTLYIIMKDLLQYVYNIMVGVVPCTLYGTSSCTIGNLSYGIGLLLWALLICHSIGIIVSIITGFFGFLTETFLKKNNGHVVDADDDDDDDSEAGEEWIPPLHQQHHAATNRAAAVPPSQSASILRLARVNNGTNNDSSSSNNNNNNTTNRKRKSSSTRITTHGNINVPPFTTATTTTTKKKRSKAERHREAIRYAKECQRLGLLGP
jgi:hypothetical protein